MGVQGRILGRIRCGDTHVQAEQVGQREDVVSSGDAEKSPGSSMPSICVRVRKLVARDALIFQPNDRLLHRTIRAFDQ